MNIKGLNKSSVLQALYNASKQQGMGFLDVTGHSPMTIKTATQIIMSGRTFFDYLNGRVMKISLENDEVSTWGYDRDNGEGAAERAIAHLHRS